MQNESFTEGNVPTEKPTPRHEGAGGSDQGRASSRPKPPPASSPPEQMAVELVRRSSRPVAKYKLRTNLSIRPDLIEWLAEHVSKGEWSRWVERRIEEARDSEHRTPAEIRLSRVLSEWSEVADKREKLREKIIDEKGAGTLEGRLGEIGTVLLEAYPDARGNWPLVRQRANEDLGKGLVPEWAKECGGIREIDVALAVDQAERIDRLTRDEHRLKTEYRVLSSQLANNKEPSSSST